MFTSRKQPLTYVGVELAHVFSFCDYCTCAGVTITIVRVFRKYVTNQHTQTSIPQSLANTSYQPDDLPIVLEDKRKPRLPHGLVFSLWSFLVIFGIWGEIFTFYNIYFSQLSYIVSNRSDERLREYFVPFKSIFTANFYGISTWFEDAYK